MTLQMPRCPLFSALHGSSLRTCSNYCRIIVWVHKRVRLFALPLMTNYRPHKYKYFSCHKTLSLTIVKWQWKVHINLSNHLKSNYRNIKLNLWITRGLINPSQKEISTRKLHRRRKSLKKECNKNLWGM